METDRDLAAACLLGKPGAWDRLWARHGPAMRRAARRAAGGNGPADEACQKALLRLSTDGGRALEAFRFSCRLETWLVTLAIHEALRLRREEARHTIPPPGPPREPLPGPLEALSRTEEAGRLREALEALPPRDHLMLTLRFWDGLDQAAIARTLGVAPGSVSVLMRRALDRLRETLEKS